MIPADPLRNLGPATILRADARHLPLADDSVDLIVTSPPSAVGVVEFLRPYVARLKLCTACGEGRRPVVDKRLTNVWHDKPPQTTKFAGHEDAHLNHRKADGAPMMQTFGSTEATITAYRCGCDTDWPVTAVQPSTTPTIILDPFGGTGTVAMVARALGRHGVHVDLSADYNRLAHWRITDLDQLAAVQGHQRTKRQPDDQPTLLDEIPEVSA